MNVTATLSRTVSALMARGRGILAADESDATINSRFRPLEIESTPENRRRYRQMLFGTPRLAEHISGVILFDETIKQSADDGRTFVRFLRDLGITPGIKVDRGTTPLAGAPGEKVTEGLDGLRARLEEYRELGAAFAKWRSVISAGDGLPSTYALEANAHVLARYARLCQEAGIVPIVEPEVLMDGDHSLEHAFDATESTLERVFAALRSQGVVLELMLLKPNMVVPGLKAARQATVVEVAEATVRCLRRTVPAAVPGIVFLSGGQPAERATSHLDAMNKITGGMPWPLGFSFARALQDPALAAWHGERANVNAAQRALHHRAWCNGAAREGLYTPEMEDVSADAWTQPESPLRTSRSFQSE